MIGKNKHPHKQRTFHILLACILCIILASASIFYFANREGQIPTTADTSVSPTLPTTATTATQTPIVVPSVTLPTPSPSVTPRPLFSDYFIDNGHGWLISNAGGYTRAIDNGDLSLTATNRKILVESVPADNPFHDFLFTTVFTFKKGDENDRVGLFLRGDSNLDHNYRIDIYGDKTYSISKESVDKNHNQVTTFLAVPTPIPAFNPPGQTNALTVIMKESSLMLLINGTIVETITDTDYTRGQIALFVQHGTTSDAVQALFSNVEVYPAPEALPTKPEAENKK